MFLPSFGLFGQVVSEETNVFKLINQKQELPVVAMLVYRSGRNVHSLLRAFLKYLLQTVDLFGQAVSEEIF
jgi:hypothetical protein